MFRRKTYGQSKVDHCPFCNSRATSTNKQGFTVCRKHVNAHMPELKCACGEYLDIMQGKFGVFFKCMSCGTMNLKKAMEINGPLKAPAAAPEKKTKKETKKFVKKEPITIRSDDPRYF